MITTKYIQDKIKPLPAEREFFINKVDLINNAKEIEYYQENISHPFLKRFIVKVINAITVDGFVFKEESNIWIENREYEVFHVGEKDIKLLLISEKFI
ncbi:MAG: hypothetical protein E2590_12740 [Chryseobacterium sp.]|nr:hypothetical protein [Chryseobacterium sp.]